MQVEKKEGIDLDEVPSFPSISPFNEIPLPPKQGGFFSKVKGVFSKRVEPPSRKIPEPSPIPPPLDPEPQSAAYADDLPERGCPEPFPETTQGVDMMPTPDQPQQDAGRTPSPPPIEMPEPQAEISPVVPDPLPLSAPSEEAKEPGPKKKEYLSTLRSELTQSLKDINDTPIRNKDSVQLSGEIGNHRKNLDDLNKELRKINSELSKLNI